MNHIQFARRLLITISKRHGTSRTLSIPSPVGRCNCPTCAPRRPWCSVDEKIHALGSVLLRAADRADRDVTLDAMRTHILEIARVRVIEVFDRLAAPAA